MPLILGITGNIACGKSLAGQYLREEAVPVLDSDEVVHELYAHDKDLQAKLRAEFGTSDRKLIADMVFGAENKAKLKTLEALIHPAVGRHFEEWLEAHQKDKIVANLVPQLYEAGLEGRYDKILVITTSPELQLSRLASRYPELGLAALQERINAQMTQEEKSKRADYLIENTGSEADLRLQIKALLEKLREY